MCLQTCLLCKGTAYCVSFILYSVSPLFTVVSFAVQRLLNLMQFHMFTLDFVFLGTYSKGITKTNVMVFSLCVFQL